MSQLVHDGRGCHLAPGGGMTIWCLGRGSQRRMTHRSANCTGSVHGGSDCIYLSHDKERYEKGSGAARMALPQGMRVPHGGRQSCHMAEEEAVPHGQERPCHMAQRRRRGGGPPLRLILFKRSRRLIANARTHAHADARAGSTHGRRHMLGHALPDSHTRTCGPRRVRGRTRCHGRRSHGSHEGPRRACLGAP